MKKAKLGRNWQMLSTKGHTNWAKSPEYNVISNYESLVSSVVDCSVISSIASVDGFRIEDLTGHVVSDTH